MGMRMVCPHCDVVAHFTEVWSDDIFEPPIRYHGKPAVRRCWVCDNCSCPICGIVPNTGGEIDVNLIWPEAVSYRAYDDVPEVIASAASAAHQALGAKAPRASGAMARAVVEATAKDKGIPSGNLQAKIDRLHSNGHISEAMKEAAHEIRFAGNEVAHGDLVQEPVSIDEATEIVELMDAILERVYQEPAKVDRIRASREARRNRQEPAVVTE